MDAEKNASQSVGILQMLEQNMQALMMQKQQFQAQIFELESASKELAKTDSAYKMVGSIMVAAKKDELEKEIKQKKELVELRLASIEKQENQIKEKVKTLQEDIMGSLKKAEK